ncbi:MAG TPA: hypothetical protein VHX59_07915 [Mycobacteriales bacterium]|jgi:hypothetical protein|nr:hypothetical protein [Mycobacteriales bacterium]
MSAQSLLQPIAVRQGIRRPAAGVVDAVKPYGTSDTEFGSPP